MLFWKKPTKRIPNRSLDDIKMICRILFIDDHKFPVVDILKTSGWINTSRIKDVDSLDQAEIRDAHILFVDIQGVGLKLKFHDEGLGLIKAIKEKYPDKKLIAYSAEHKGKVEAFHEGLDKADNRLSKSADPYEFQFLVEKHAKQAFSLHECIKRIQGIILSEFGDNRTTSDIAKSLEKLYNHNDASPKAIARIFKLENGANIAQIVQLFLQI